MASIFNLFGNKNVLVIKDHTQVGGYSEGGVYVGGTAQYKNYNIGTTLPVASQPEAHLEAYSLFVQGNMNITGGTNTQNSALSPSGTITEYTMSSSGGLIGQPIRTNEWLYSTTNLINWLEATSNGLAGLDTNGTATLSETILTLTGSSPSLNTFTIDGDNILGIGVPIANVTQINFNLLAGSTALINIIGKSIELNAISAQVNLASLEVAQAQKIIWNMPAATSLTLNCVIYGTVLAPSATTTAIAASQLYGTLFTGNLVGALIAKSAIFDGDLPMIVNLSVPMKSTNTTDEATSSTTIDITKYASTSYAACAVNDIIESVALEQTALAHILNAEGEKIQKVIQMGATLDQMLKINASVKNMINAIVCLETILQAKLTIVKRGIC